MTTGPRTPEVTYPAEKVGEMSSLASAVEAAITTAKEYGLDEEQTRAVVEAVLHTLSWTQSEQDLATTESSEDAGNIDPKEVLRESIEAVIEAGTRAIEAGEGTRFSLKLRQIADDVMHWDDAEQGIQRTGHNVFAVMSDQDKVIN